MAPSNYVFQPYPSVRYRNGETTIVRNQEEDDALDASWTDSPATVGAPVPSEDDLKELIRTAPGTGQSDKIGSEAAAAEGQRAREVWAASAEEVLGVIGSATSVDDLKTLAAYEASSKKPKGGRKNVLKAIEARIAVLSKT